MNGRSAINCAFRQAETERDRAMRIGITCYPTYGGSGVVATELGIELAAIGHEVHFISYSQPFRLTGRDNGIFYHEVPVSNYPLFEFPPYDLALASRMAEVAEFYELDLLHVHYAIPHSVSALLARQMLAARGRRLPFVTTLHGTDITLVGLDRSYLPITRFSIQESDGVTSISKYLKDKTVEDFEIARPIEVIPNFVNCDVYTPYNDEAVRSEARRRLANPGEAILIHLSNFRPVKRVTDVVKVFARVVEQVPARLVLVGDGPDRSAAEWLAHELQINDKIHFLGKQERVNELLPLADLMVMPSQLESFGLAALEAMACRVPTIATNVGGVPELIDAGVNGLLFPVGDVDNMAEGAIELLKNRERLEIMRDAARKTARSRFCSTLVLPLYVEYYERILATAQ
jgi:N-acetyl-alpha-D-glucosaminyl L-malate synthase BshA